MIKSFLKKVTFGATVVGLSAGQVQAAVTQVEGQAGGGIVPWALIATGKPTGSFTWVDSGDYTLTSVAIQAGFMDKFEISYALQTFDTKGVGLGKVDVDVFGAKVNLVSMSEGWPAISVGIQHKRTDISDGFLTAVGADDSGTDVYLAATKVFSVGSKKVLLNGTLRATKANQIGILGFGSSSDDDYSYRPEITAGVFLTAETVIGIEYRAKPDNINGLDEEAWADFWIAYFPSKSMSMTVAYADLGNIVHEANGTASDDVGKDQRGLYFQVQGNF